MQSLSSFANLKGVQTVAVLQKINQSNKYFGVGNVVKKVEQAGKETAMKRLYDWSKQDRVPLKRHATLPLAIYGYTSTISVCVIQNPRRHNRFLCAAILITSTCV